MFDPDGNGDGGQVDKWEGNVLQDADENEQDDDKTPLYHKLDKIALDIGKLGTIFALLTFHALMIRFIWEGLIDRNIDLFGGEKGPEDGCND